MPNTEVCTASPKERRKFCEVFNPNFVDCCACQFFIDSHINLGQEGMRGGVETAMESYEWRKNKWRFGIPHGDS